MTHGGRAAVPVLIVALLGACGPGRVTIAMVNDPEGLDAARLALADAGRDLDVDTVLVTDGSGTAEPAVRTAERLAEVPGMVAVVGHLDSSGSIAAAPVYGAAGIVQVAASSTADLYGSMGPFSFRMVPPDRRQAGFLARTIALDYPGGARIAVLYVNDDYGRGLSASMIDSLNAARYPVVLDLPHTRAELDAGAFDYATGAIEAAAPDLIVWLASGDNMRDLILRLRTRGLDVAVLGGDAAAPEGTRGSATRSLAALRWASFLDMHSSAALVEFARRYREAFGRDATPTDALAYDAMRVLLAGVREGARSGEAMRVYLTSLGQDRPAFPGVTGRIAFGADRHVERAYVLVGTDLERQE